MSIVLQWTVAAAILLLIPLLVRFGRGRARGKAGAAMLLIGLAFGSLFDPAKAEAMETVHKRRDQREEAGQDGG
ncbi:hypothetical protein [Sphingomonas elodea]|uniref:hypothetical protein n=1 Tax=Sphingomonas elodea TaxID=179878 RepID=UPI0002631658|nr:hypothetical protein [Sphingomonas elodea]